ncbi:MAG: toll/interleukin-1 receptor domain-containing protein [Blastocatellia bacterium]
MANKRHLKRLWKAVEKGILEWNKWRIDHPETEVNLSFADLSFDPSGANPSLATLLKMEPALLIGCGTNLAGVNFSRTNLTDVGLRLANLSGANLAKAFLPGSTLSWADLRNTDLSRAHLYGANLSRANLSGADLSGADLSFADLTSANLSGANLSGADLSFANLSGANLNSANLAGVCLSRSLLSDLDLSEVKGLDSVRHEGPSTIGIDTFYKSRGRIPDVFLTGCGVPDDFITYVRSLVGKAIEFYTCFISYSHEDKLFARRLHDQLQGRGIRCWLDEHQVLPGHEILEEVDRGIRLWDKVLLCASKKSLTSWWVDDEIARAFDKEQQIMKERGRKVLALIPLNLDGFLFDGWTSAKANQVRQRLAADFTGWGTDTVKFEEQFDRVVRALRTDEGREPAPASRL